jgi:hypothetical protein
MQEDKRDQPTRQSQRQKLLRLAIFDNKKKRKEFKQQQTKDEDED